MLKRFLPLLFLLLSILAACHKDDSANRTTATRRNTIVLYCDDEFMSSGLGQKVLPLFEQKYKCHVDVVNLQDTNQLMERLKAEKNHPKADVVIGLNNMYLTDILENNLLDDYYPTGMHVIQKDFLYDPSFHLVPYGYGYLGILYDSDVVLDPPDNFGELQDFKYKQDLLVPDAMKSCLGRATLFWTVAAFGEDGYEQFWRSIRKNISQITPTAFNARQLFMQSDGVMMVGYTTTPAYYSETMNNDRVKCFVPLEGSFLVMPSAGIIRKAPNLSLSRKFMDFMLSESFQKMVPETQWIYPIDSSIQTPPSFSLAPLSVITVNDRLTSDQILTNSSKWFDFWSRYISFVE
ncbi:MAG TPA: thiamine ABC transporter substrate-binding protein [Candidatus Cloacimonadota bacterium]|nr:thiamine ABC transporter substrate-binding protein [Candidatus Cloacimonadota bacterium]HPT71362.1 thiamine ABC transporter substrate-binding protein [Candidatus Cloacimonadota bacterium]